MVVGNDRQSTQDAATGAALQTGRLLVLLTNDDGVHAPGIAAARAALEAIGDVHVVAPDREQSGTSHSLTLNRPLRIQQLGDRLVSVDGTPTDCVLVACNSLLPRRPDLVVSGVNAGQNMGEDVSYSGTVAAAMEGTVLGIPSIAVSLAINERRDYAAAASVAADVAQVVARRGLPRGSFLNVNVPDLPRERIAGVRITKLSTRVYRDVVVEKLDPRGRPYYWIGGEPVWESGTDTDWEAVQASAVSITPLHLDMTDYRALEMLRGWTEAWANGNDPR
jgi:5'-nucleotidase